MANQTLTIRNWDQGIADSPHNGFQLIKNANIEESLGAIKANNKPTSLFQTAISETFTANADTEVITITGTFPVTGTAVTVSNAGGALPTGLSANTNYFLIKLTDTTAKLATTITNAFAGTAINLTTAGTGTNTVATVNAGVIKHIIQGDGYYIAQDDNGRVWYSETYFFLLNGNTLTNPNGNGIVLFENSDATATYLFVFRNAKIDVVEVTALANRRTPSWSNDWQALNSGATSDNSHHCIKGQDNIIYFCDDKYIGSIKENKEQVFAPATPATYIYNSQALDLPSGELAYWLVELGTNLLISSATTTGKIYPWDRISGSFYYPLQVPENYVYRMVNMGNIIYIQAGSQGNIYQTQGSYVRLFKKLPYSVINNTGALSATPITWGGIGEKAGALVVGVDATSTGNDGVYLIYPDGRVIIDNQPLSGSANVTALCSVNNGYVMGFDGGVDALSTTRYSSYETVIQTGIYRMATKTGKSMFSTLEVVTAKVPSSGTDYVRVKYRSDNNPATEFTTIKEFIFNSSSDAIQTYDAGISDLDNIQFQIELSGNVELIELRLIP